MLGRLCFSVQWAGGRLGEPLLGLVSQRGLPGGIGFVTGIDFDLHSLLPVVVIELNHGDFDTRGIPVSSNGQDSEKEDQPVAFYIVELITGNPEIGEVFIRLAEFGDGVVPGWMGAFYE